jgi:hypothetical protein
VEVKWSVNGYAESLVPKVYGPPRDSKDKASALRESSPSSNQLLGGDQLSTWMSSRVSVQLASIVERTPLNTTSVRLPLWPASVVLVKGPTNLSYGGSSISWDRADLRL